MQASMPPTYTVQPGDTLSAIGERYGVPWPELAAVNGIPDANLIFPGQRFTIRRGNGEETAVKITPSAPRHHYRIQPAPTVWSGAGGGFRDCVISRESGGNASAVNPTSGAGGLYQFLPSTWASLGYGGRPQDAPVWQQNEAFQRLYASAGTSPWRPYDGC